MAGYFHFQGIFIGRAIRACGRFFHLWRAIFISRISSSGGQARKKAGVLAPGLPKSQIYCTVTLTGLERIPLAITNTWLAPVSVLVGMSTLVDTEAFPVATPIVL